MESTLYTILVILFSLFSLFSEDIRILFLPFQIDYIFVNVNEAIFIFFIFDLFFVTLFNKNHFGSFYFFLDLIAIISSLPDVKLIWTPISIMFQGEEVNVYGNDPFIDNFVGNLNFVSTSKNSKIGSK